MKYWQSTYKQVNKPSIFQNYVRTVQLKGRGTSNAVEKGRTDRTLMVSHNTMAYRPFTVSKPRESRNQAGAVYTAPVQLKNDLNTTAPSVYNSVSKLSFYNHGDSSKIRATLDEDRRADLRRSHFKVGETSHPMITHSQATFYRPRSAVGTTTAASLRNRGAELRQNNWTFGDNS